MRPFLGWILDQLQRWQAGYTAWAFVKGIFVPATTSGIATYLAMLEHIHVWQVFLVALYGFAGGTLLALAWKRARPLESTGGISRQPTTIRALERYYVSLASLREHVRRLRKFAELGGTLTGIADISLAVDKIRNELMNLAPSLLTTSDAIGLQAKPSDPNAEYVPQEERVSKAIDELMTGVLRLWGRYGEPKGITPLHFRENPIVKLSDE
jgi:hypothetical protein